MRLQVVERGHAPAQREVLDRLRAERGAEPTDVLKTFCYRPELFGEAFSGLVDATLRGESDWSVGERELLATFVSAQNQCLF